MIGTALIALVGYGLALIFAYEFVAHGYRSITVDGLKPGEDSKFALGAALMALIVASLTRWLTGI